jgi:hypothetical protein
MAKRPTKSRADDAAAAPAQPKARRPRGVKQLGPESVSGLERPPDMAETYAGRQPAGAGAAPEEPRADPQPLGTGALSMSSEPSEEDIRMRAYQMYLERGGRHGMDFDDWLRAERELRERRS